MPQRVRTPRRSLFEDDAAEEWLHRVPTRWTAPRPVGMTEPCGGGGRYDSRVTRDDAITEPQYTVVSEGLESSMEIEPELPALGSGEVAVAEDDGAFKGAVDTDKLLASPACGADEVFSAERCDSDFDCGGDRDGEACCPICLSDLPANPAGRRTLAGCGHTFCDSCLEQWYLAQHGLRSCPMSRRCEPSSFEVVVSSGADTEREAGSKLPRPLQHFWHWLTRGRRPKAGDTPLKLLLSAEGIECWQEAPPASRERQSAASPVKVPWRQLKTVMAEKGGRGHVAVIERRVSCSADEAMYKGRSAQPGRGWKIERLRIQALKAPTMYDALVAHMLQMAR